MRLLLGGRIVRPSYFLTILLLDALLHLVERLATDPDSLEIKENKEKHNGEDEGNHKIEHLRLNAQPRHKLHATDEGGRRHQCVRPVVLAVTAEDALILLVFLQQALTIVSPFFLESFLYHKFLLGSVIQKDR